MREAQRLGFTRRDVYSFIAAAIPVALLLGVLNGVLFQMVTRRELPALAEFLDTGLVSFGAALGAFFTGWVAARLRRQPAAVTMDIIAPALALILGVYRIGCLLNGCCYGILTDGPWGVNLPGRFGDWADRYPTQVMYMVLDFALFGWLWLRRKGNIRPGSQAVIFLLSFSIGRLLIDSLRDLPRLVLGMNHHQLAALAILLATLAAAIIMKRRAA